MSAKVRFDRDAWWVVTHFEGRKKRKRIGPTKADRRLADEIARKINAAIALGQFALDEDRPEAIPLDRQLRAWHRQWAPTFKRSYEILANGLIENHLVPFFSDRDMRTLREEDLLEYTRAKVAEGLRPSTIKNALSLLRRVCNLARRDGLIDRNPTERLGELMRRVDRRSASEVSQVDAWSVGELDTLLAVAFQHEPRFYTALLFLLSTGTRRGELLGLKWEDVDLERRRVTIRRAIVSGEITTPKSGRSRSIAMPPGLTSALFDLLASRRQECIQRGWPETPGWVFCSEVGGPLEGRNLERSWRRVRRRAQKAGVRPLRLHCTRHTYASRALATGKSVRWVADQLGHANPELTLRTYAHVLPEEEADLAFADFAVPDNGPGRPYAAPPSADSSSNDDAPDATGRGRSQILERETGFEPATLSLGKRRTRLK